MQSDYEKEFVFVICCIGRLLFVTGIKFNLPVTRTLPVL